MQVALANWKPQYRMNKFRRTLIVGLGKTGLSCARYLSQRGEPVAVTDSRPRPPQLKDVQEQMSDVALFTGGYDANAFNAADRIIVSPGVDKRHSLIVDAVKRGIPVIGDVELFAQYVDAPVIAITGSNGKSTVTALISEMVKAAGLRVKMGGNFGIPALDLLSINDGPSSDQKELSSEPLSTQKKHTDFYVLELSSFQLESTFTLKPTVAVLLNLSPDHMDRYVNFEAYRAAKLRVYSGSEKFVLNRDESCVPTLTTDSKNVIGFGMGIPKEGDFGLRLENTIEWLSLGTKRLLLVDRVAMRGRHNINNALAALAVGYSIKLPMDCMLEVLTQFPGLPHRMQWVGSKQGCDWYNDSKATNPGATLAALVGMSSHFVLIAGGQAKGADFLALRSVMSAKARAVVLIGSDATKIADELAGTTTIIYANSMDDAVTKAQKCAQVGDSVLLSPACASFDMYSGYEERGCAFINAFNKLS